MALSPALSRAMVRVDTSQTWCEAGAGHVQTAEGTALPTQRSWECSCAKPHVHVALASAAATNTMACGPRPRCSPRLPMLPSLPISEELGLAVHWPVEPRALTLIHDCPRYQPNRASEKLVAETHRPVGPGFLVLHPSQPETCLGGKMREPPKCGGPGAPGRSFPVAHVAAHTL